MTQKMLHVSLEVGEQDAPRAAYLLAKHGVFSPERSLMRGYGLDNRSGPGLGFLIFFPILYLAFGFIFTVIDAWVYNLAARWVGGVEYTSVAIGTPG